MNTAGNFGLMGISRLFAGFCVYLACGCSGLILSRRLALNNLLKRVVFVFVVGAAQLLFSIQLLSIFHWLNGPCLFATTLLITLGIRSLIYRGPVDSKRVPWRELLDNSWDRICAADGLPIAGLFLFVSLTYFLITLGIGWLLMPTGDMYHFEMPLFWRQNASMLPF